jgi:ABC-type transporter Mla subunit MlaD
MEGHLLDLPGDIQAGINPGAIAAKIAESIRQAFVQTELPAIVQQLHLHAGNLSDSTQQLASLANTLNDPHSGAPARLQRALSSMLANLANAAAHVRCLATDLNREIGHAVLFLCSAALLLGFLIG